jgi:hypothetical protein
MLREQGNHDVMKRVLYRAADTAPVMNQLRRLLKDEPEALKQIETNREERVAYMYQFYAKDKLTLGGDTQERDRQAQGLLPPDARHLDQRPARRAHHGVVPRGQLRQPIGDRNAVSRALMEPGRNQAVEYLKGAIEPFGKLERR